jgi:hypothetical protein
MLINLRRLQTSKHTRSLHLSYSFGLLIIRKGGSKSHNMTIGTALFVQNESSFSLNWRDMNQLSLFKRLRSNIRPVLHAFELDHGYGLIRTSACFGNIASAANDAKHPAAVRYELAILLSCTCMEY